jgi:hypothetical protein
MSCQNVVYHAPALGQQQHVSFLANIIQNLFFLNIKLLTKTTIQWPPQFCFGSRSLLPAMMNGIGFRKKQPTEHDHQ